VPPSSERRLGDEPTRADVAQTLALDLAADWISPSVARDQVRGWLQANRWSPSHVDDLVLAINEAVSNSIEHGYQLTPEGDRVEGQVTVHGAIHTAADGFRHVEFTVADKGIWLPPTEGRSVNRGQGIRLMRACVDHLTIDGTDDGTTVVLQSRPVPPSLRSV
jgi:anti-sigma regulatory factor (Ser/Thr protein kinase)